MIYKLKAFQKQIFNFQNILHPFLLKKPYLPFTDMSATTIFLRLPLILYRYKKCCFQYLNLYSNTYIQYICNMTYEYDRYYLCQSFQTFLSEKMAVEIFQQNGQKVE